MVTDVWFGITVGSSRGLVGSEGQWAAGRGAEVQRGRHGPGDPLGDLLLAHGRTPLDVLSNECVLPCPTRMRRPGFTVVHLAAETRVVPEHYLTRCPTSSSGAIWWSTRRAAPQGRATRRAGRPGQPERA